MGPEHASREKITYGKFFDFCAEKCVYNKIPRDQNPPMKGFWENAFFVFLHYRGIGVFWPKIPLNLTSEGLNYRQEVRVQEAPKCVKDPWNNPKMIPPTAPDWFESIFQI